MGDLPCSLEIFYHKFTLRDTNLWKSSGLNWRWLSLRKICICFFWMPRHVPTQGRGHFSHLSKVELIAGGLGPAPPDTSWKFSLKKLILLHKIRGHWHSRPMCAYNFPCAYNFTLWFQPIWSPKGFLCFLQSQLCNKNHFEQDNYDCGHKPQHLGCLF